VTVDDEVSGARESRRSVLRKIAVGGAVAWSAPVLLSSPASAATGSPQPTTTTESTLPPQCDSGPWECGNDLVLCGTSGLDGICNCDTDVHGNDFCWGNFPCGDPRVVDCAANTDCPPGWACTTTCCGQTCAPPCDGTFGESQGVQGGPTAVAA
jgi:hypothetical protein